MYPQINKTESTSSLAKIVTNFGEILVELFPEYAPKTVENFTKLSMKGYYDGTIFHRVIKDFMIQGGDPTGTGAGGDSSFGGSFEDEFSPELFNINGALSMANAGPNTNGSQFFIVTNEHVDDGMIGQMKQAGYPDEIIDTYKNGGTPWLDFRHTVFGQVIDGMNVVKEISGVKRSASDKPEDDVVMTTVEITK